MLASHLPTSSSTPDLPNISDLAQAVETNAISAHGLGRADARESVRPYGRRRDGWCGMYCTAPGWLEVQYLVSSRLSAGLVWVGSPVGMAATREAGARRGDKYFGLAVERLLLQRAVVASRGSPSSSLSFVLAVG